MKGKGRKVKESRSRQPVTQDHPVVAAAIYVLEDWGGPLSSREIFELAVGAGLLGEGQYNTLRARLSQHSGLPPPECYIERAPGSRVARGSRTTAWVLCGAQVSETIMREVLKRNFARTANRRGFEEIAG